MPIFVISAEEIPRLSKLAEDYAPVYRQYTLNIFDESGVRIAEVHKTLYIRRKKTKAVAT